MYNYEASFFVWLTEALYLTKFQKAAICVRDFQGVWDTTLNSGRSFLKITKKIQVWKSEKKLEKTSKATKSNMKFKS